MPSKFCESDFQPRMLYLVRCQSNVRVKALSDMRNQAVLLLCIHSQDWREDVLHQVKEYNSRRWKISGSGSKGPPRREQRATLEVQAREAWQLSNRAQQQPSWGDSTMRETVRRRLQEGNSRENSGTVKFGIQWQSWSDQKEWGTTYKNNANF